MRIKAIKAFYDEAEKTMREAGEVFDVTVKRLTEINKSTFGVLAEEVEPQKLETPEVKKKKPSRR